MKYQLKIEDVKPGQKFTIDPDTFMLDGYWVFDHSDEKNVYAYHGAAEQFGGNVPDERALLKLKHGELVWTKEEWMKDHICSI